MSSQYFREHLRDLGTYLIDLATSNGEPAEKAFDRAIPLAPFEHKNQNIDDRAYLCRLAREEYNERQRRKSFLEEDLLGEPAWNMLLDMFINYALERKISVTSACYASAVPHTTALRYIDILESRMLVVRTPDGGDRRRTWIELTPHAARSMAEYLVERGKRRRADTVSGTSFSPVRRSHA